MSKDNIEPAIYERVHAAFILQTSINHWGNLNEKYLSWLMFAYPKSELKTGVDQGAIYTTITPKQ